MNIANMSQKGMLQLYVHNPFIRKLLKWTALLTIDLLPFGQSYTQFYHTDIRLRLLTVISSSSVIMAKIKLKDIFIVLFDQERLTTFILRAYNYANNRHLFLRSYAEYGFRLHILFHSFIIKEIQAKLGTMSTVICYH